LKGRNGFELSRCQPTQEWPLYAHSGRPRQRLRTA
jgi:hypothetical protein